MILQKLNSFLKGFLLFSRAGFLLKPFSHIFKFISNFSNLTVWINKYHKTTSFTDFYTPVKKYDNRLKLFSHVSGLYDLKATPMQYYEFGVAGAASFRWWLNENKNPSSSFWGFDTFEGLPEDWHFYKKGDMSHHVPEINDERALFIKGLFQDTFFKFLKAHPPDSSVRKVIHMDADLYSSTLFILTSLAPYLQDGDIIFFDEFNVPNHEFAARQQFTDSFYVKYELLGGVNNYYQTAFLVKDYNVG